MNPKEIRPKIQKLAKKYQLYLVLLFGSRAADKTNVHAESDFDIAYLSKKPLNLMKEAKLVCELMPIFQSDKIDLVNLKKAPPLLFYAALNNCLLLYEENPLTFFNLRSYAYKRYIETKPLYEEKYNRLQKEIAAL